MLLEQICEQLKSIETDITIINAYCHNMNLEQNFKTLEKLTLDESIWQNPNQITLLKEFSQVKNKYEELLHINTMAKDLKELIGLFSQNETELNVISQEARALKSKVKKFKMSLLLHHPNDSHNCYLNINAGAGGTEAQDWASVLLRMYLRFCEQESFQTSMIDYQDGEEAGIKSATLFVKGKNAYGFLKNEHGIHRLVRISPFDSNKRRHTSFAGVMVTPEIAEVSFQIDPKDLRIDTYRASGAGGQHVNKTESAIRITHIPTNIVVQCQVERSQTQNKETAMRMLQSKLAQKYQQEHEEKTLGNIEKKKIEWGSQIRSYVLHPYKMVKDHRTDHESMQPEIVLDGHIMDFIESNLVKNATSY
ncbi:peptide chain release factor 2 [bacterium]|nr:MAG: peptide chain release factor 2 [bacterium]QQR61501.1 MAG: peptide chain release factor 2 [bacterium]QQR62971.1 MAG: peptide chain release factor 2 [bacterium]